MATLASYITIIILIYKIANQKLSTTLFNIDVDTVSIFAII